MKYSTFLVLLAISSTHLAMGQLQIPRLILPRQEGVANLGASLVSNPSGTSSMTDTGAATESTLGITSTAPMGNGAAGGGIAETAAIGTTGGGDGMNGIATTSADNAGPKPTAMGQWAGIGAGAAGMALGMM